MNRLTKDEYGISLARVVASRGECSRRSVGAVICDEDGRILSTGFNGVAPGSEPCSAKSCPGFGAKSGTNMSGCRASHAEISALVHLREPHRAYTIYCTTEPCIECTKAILLTSIQRVIFIEPYVNSGVKLWDRQHWGKWNENTIQA